MFDKRYAGYIPQVGLVEALESKFDGDLHTMSFDDKSDFDAYLCALAYGSLGKQLFYDSRFADYTDKKLLENKAFMQGMLHFSILEKIQKAERILQSFDFEKTRKVDLSKFDEENDYATIAFILFYLRTKGYTVEWDKVSHSYTPINLENGPVSFTKSKQIKPSELLSYVEETLLADKNV